MKTVLTVVIAAMLCAPSTFAQFSQQGSKLVGTGAVGNAFQGRSVAISADGNTAVVGGILDNGGAGAAWVWTRSGGVWSQQGTKLVGSGAIGNSNQGHSVSISADGNTAIVGAPLDNGDAGAAWVWTRTGGVWSQQGNKLVGSGAAGNAQQGYSVSLSADGNTAIVGGPFDNNRAGAVWVWIRNAGVWTQQGNKLIGSGAAGNNSRQGHSVSLSADGSTAITGGFGDNAAHGAAWVWTRNGAVWAQQGNKLVGLGAVSGVGNAWQGWAVSMSADGNTAIISAVADNNNTGAVWVWTRIGSLWIQQSPKLTAAGNVGAALFGNSVSLSGDGDTAFVGGSGGGDGGIWIWERSGSVWTQLGEKRAGLGAEGGAQQGTSVSLSADGNTAIVGGPLDKGFAGAAWIFTRTAAPRRRHAVRH